MVILLEGSPISTEELWSSVSDHRVLGHLPDQGPSPQLLRLAWLPALGRVLVVPNLFHLWMMEDTVFLGTFHAARCCTLTQSCLWALQKIILTPWLVFFLICTVNCGTVYRQVCPSKSYPINWIYHRWRNISRMINGNRMHPSSISSLIAKGLNTYVNK